MAQPGLGARPLMKSFLFAVLVIVFTRVAYPDEILPADPKTPLIEIYDIQFDPPKKDEPPHHHSGHAGKVLLSVYSLRDLLLQADRKGVRVVLNDEDAKVFASLTHKYPYLVLVASPKAGVIMHIAAPIEDGSILFDKSTYAVPVAEYLRRRFHVKPDSNDFEPPRP